MLTTTSAKIQLQKGQLRLKNNGIVVIYIAR